MSVGSGLSAKMVSGRHAKPGGGLSGEVFDTRQDVARVFALLAAITVQEFTNPIAASVNAIKAAAASVAAPVTYAFADFDGALASAPSTQPRNLSVTVAGATPADAPATVTFTGLYRGKPQTETINAPQTATTASTTKPFDVDAAGLAALVVSAPAADGTGATLAFGIGTGLGVGAKPRTRAGGVTIVREIVDGVVVTDGVLTATGLYTPNTAPDGAHDYAIYIEFDAAAEITS